MQKLQETVLYYHAGDPKDARTLYGMLIRLGIRIRKVEPEQVLESVGYLAGMPGYEPASERVSGEACVEEGRENAGAGTEKETEADMEKSSKANRSKANRREIPIIPESVLVMRNFTSSRMDFLLYNLRKAKLPPIPMKAVVTPTNAGWSFYQLYEELKEEHARMHGMKKEGNEND